MSFRTRLLTLLLVFAAVALVTSSGAFTSVSAGRTVTVDVSGDDAALLGLTPHSGPNGDDAELQDGQFQINFGGVGADGVNQNAVTVLSNVFNITNRGTETVSVTITESGNHPDLVTFSAGGGDIDDGGSVSIPVGESAEVSIEIDTTGTSLSAGTSLIDSITIEAQA